jgi:hypothetical protein
MEGVTIEFPSFSLAIQPFCIPNAHKQAIKVGTIFSGSDIIIKTLVDISGVLNDVYGINLPIEHVFACEKDPDKQKFLISQQRPQMLFANASSLREPIVTDVLTGSPGDSWI